MHQPAGRQVMLSYARPLQRKGERADAGAGGLAQGTLAENQRGAGAHGGVLP